jgi:hypothetical protein
MYAIMLRQLNLFTLAAAISIASFDATFFVLANLYGLTGRDIALGVIAAGAGGLLLDAVVAANIRPS